MTRVPVSYEPLLAWPGALRTDEQRQHSDFRASWSDTREVLDREALMLDGERVTIRLAAEPGAFRQDGTGLRADRTPQHPGVVLVLDTPAGALTYHTDRFVRRGYRDQVASWQHNVRAIALGMEALRRVERYGIADAGQQYAGFKALGAGVAMLSRPEPLTLDQAAALLAAAGEDVKAATVLKLPHVAQNCWRAALRLLHPDHGGSGDGEKMARLNDAWALVKAHHGM